MKRYPEVHIEKRPYYLNEEHRGEEIITLTQLRIKYEGVWYLQTFRHCEFLVPDPSNEEILARALRAIHLIHSYVYQHVVLGTFDPDMVDSSGLKVHEVDQDQRDEAERMGQDFYKWGSPSQEELNGLLKV